MAASVIASHAIPDTSAQVPSEMLSATEFVMDERYVGPMTDRTEHTSVRTVPR